MLSLDHSAEFPTKQKPILQSSFKVKRRTDTTAVCNGLFSPPFIWTHKKGNKSSGIVVAGGMALYMLTGVPTKDVDIFCYGMTENEMLAKFAECYFASYDWSCPRSIVTDITVKKHLIEWWAFPDSHPLSDEMRSIHYQFILQPYSSIESILNRFDLDCCRVAFNNDQYFVMPAAIKSISRQTLSDNDVEHAKLPRIAKYVQKGFTVNCSKLVIRCTDEDMLNRYKLHHWEYDSSKHAPMRVEVHLNDERKFVVIPNKCDIFFSNGVVSSVNLHSVNGVRLRHSDDDYSMLVGTPIPLTHLNFFIGIYGTVPLRENNTPVFMEAVRERALMLAKMPMLKYPEELPACFHADVKSRAQSPCEPDSDSEVSE